MPRKQVLPENPTPDKVQRVTNPPVTINLPHSVTAPFQKISQTTGEEQQNGKRIKFHKPT